LEDLVAELRPPVWDEGIFGLIDRKLAETGKGIFVEHCASCHNVDPYRRTDPSSNLFGKTFIEIGRVDYQKVATDPAYVTALATRWVIHDRQASGSSTSVEPHTLAPLSSTNLRNLMGQVTTSIATGARVNLQTRRFSEGAPVPAATFFFDAVGKLVGEAMSREQISDSEKIRLSGFRLRPSDTPGGAPRPYEPTSISDLKAGPLAGIWASGPYLHNGSVPTVYELLSPESERRRLFWTGGHELDRKRLGYISDDAPDRFLYDTSVPGNSNAGHLYPPGGLEPAQRRAIIEYLKTLDK
jgi:hypothetical protein